MKVPATLDEVYRTFPTERPSMRRPAPSSLDVTPLPVALATPVLASPFERTTRLPSALSLTSRLEVGAH